MNTRTRWKIFLSFTMRVILAHTLTYFIFGAIMSNVFAYGEIFKREIISDYMLPIDQHDVLLGPFLQPVRGLIFAVGLWPIRGLLLEKKRGWLILWGLLVTIGILSTPAASPSSVEGILYTKLPLWYHLMGLPEITLQTLAFSIWLVWWERQALKSQEPTVKEDKPLVAEIVKALMVSCFAFIGYAIGGLLLAFMTNARAAAAGADGIDIAAVGMSFKVQFQFVIAFAINTLTVFWIERRMQATRISMWNIFLLFWLVDAFVPWLYQTIIFGSSFVPTALLLGFLPAAIITISIRMNYRNSPLQEGL